MIKQSVLQELLQQQQFQFVKNNKSLKRDLLIEFSSNEADFAYIISGIRRCGKSTLMHQLIAATSEKSFFINFDSAKLYNFEIDDFLLLDKFIDESGSKTLFFDEIQVVKGWELYVRQKLDENYRVIVTGSNASLLSKELGTKLTGRHISKELFPFSYNEFCTFKEIPNTAQTLALYMEIGGFPAYIKTENPDIHNALLEDIMYRDVAVRHNIRDVQSLKRLLTYMATNISNLVSASKLTQALGIKSSATVLEYIVFFEQSYLIQLMPKFSYSYKVQLVNPRKIYFIDNGLQAAISGSYNNDLGRKLENMVFWELRRLQKELFYYNENAKECDFVVSKNKKIEQLIQVCYELTNENQGREIEGLLDAMNYFELSVGIILTFNQSDIILRNSKRIDVIPVYEFFTKPSGWLTEPHTV